MKTYEVYIDFGNNIKADNPVEAVKKAVKMIDRNKAQLIRVIEKDSNLLVFEVMDSHITEKLEASK